MQFSWKLEPSSSELFVYIYGSPLLLFQDEVAPTEGLHERSSLFRWVKLYRSACEALLLWLVTSSAPYRDHYCFTRRPL